MDYVDSKDKTKYIERYSERFSQHGYDPKTLGWGGGKDKQNYRFASLSKVGNLSNESVLDVGCGFGDLYGYLLSNGWKGMYLGIDIVPVLIKQAKELCPYANFEEVDLLTNEVDMHFDYVFASGIFNAKVESCGSNQEYIIAMLTKMFEIANVAVVVDFMSTYVDFEQDIAFHTNPEWAFSIAKSLSKRVVLRHDYMPFEFCLYIYKDDEITTNYTFNL